MPTITQQLHDRLETQRADALASYDALVIDVAAGVDNAEIDYIDEVLRASGQSAAELEADVALLLKRKRLAKTIVESESFTAEHGNVPPRLRQAEQEREELLKPIDAKIAGLKSELRELRRANSEKNDCTKQLIDSAPSWCREELQGTTRELQQAERRLHHRPTPVPPTLDTFSKDPREPIPDNYAERLAEFEAELPDMQADVARLRRRKAALEALAREPWPTPDQLNEVLAELRIEDDDAIGREAEATATLRMLPTGRTHG